MSSDGASPRSIKRQSKSCKRCLKRKQRCYGFPVCSACEKAKQPCEQSEYALQLHTHDTGYAAFKQIQTLETQLASALDELSALRQGQQSLTYSASDLIVDRLSQPASQNQGQLEIPLIFNEGFVSPDSAILESQAELAGGACPINPTPRSSTVPLGRYLGDNYGMGLPVVGSPPESAIEKMVQDTVWAKPLSSVGENGYVPTSQPSVQSLGGQPPEDGIGRRMLEAYFEKIHPRYPFLERSEVFQLHTRRYDPVPATQANRFRSFKLNMVYAIGGTLLKLTDPYSETQAEGLLATALQDLPSVQQSHTLDAIEGMVLLALYGLRSLSNIGIWYMVGLAMRTCIDLGLHLESSYTADSPYQNQKKRRLFWSVYILERFVALALRRPFSLAEQDIETRAPLESEELLTDQDFSGSVGFSPPRPKAKLTWWAKLIEIKRFESRIQSDVYCVNETRQERFAKIEPWLASLDAWVQSLPYFTESETSYLQLQWSGAVSQLLRPFLCMMHDDNPLILRCLKAAGQVCDIFKRMHQRDNYGHSFVSAHLIFIAGVTMCYCLFLSPKLFNNAVANSLRACSSTMFVIAERSHKLRKHRDILEDIIGRIIDSPTSPCLIPSDFDGLHSQRFSHRDFIAVQSLLNLAAQQEPQEISGFNP